MDFSGLLLFLLVEASGGGSLIFAVPQGWHEKLIESPEGPISFLVKKSAVTAARAGESWGDWVLCTQAIPRVVLGWGRSNRAGRVFCQPFQEGQFASLLSLKLLRAKPQRGGSRQPWREPTAGSVPPTWKPVEETQDLPPDEKVAMGTFLVKASKPIKDWKSSPVVQMVKNLLAMQESWVQSPGQEDPLEKEMATRSSILVWRMPMDRGAWRAIVHGVTKNRTCLSNFHFQRLKHAITLTFCQMVSLHWFPSCKRTFLIGPCLNAIKWGAALIWFRTIEKTFQGQQCLQAFASPQGSWISIKKKKKKMLFCSQFNQNVNGKKTENESWKELLSYPTSSSPSYFAVN